MPAAMSAVGGGARSAAAAPPPLLSVLAEVAREYAATASTRERLCDSVLLAALVTAAIQLAYCALGSFPFNSFLAGFFCSLGVFVLTGERTARGARDVAAAHACTPGTGQPPLQPHCRACACGCHAFARARCAASSPRAPPPRPP